MNGIPSNAEDVTCVACLQVIEDADNEALWLDANGKAAGPPVGDPYHVKCDPGLPEQAAEELIPSVVDGPIRPEDMCAGSEGRQVMFCGNTVHCSTCLRWLPAYPGSFLAPVHRRPEFVHHTAACGRCWTDFVTDQPTAHACDCDVCVPAGTDLR